MLDEFCRSSLECFDGGGKLAVSTTDNTIAVWDRRRNTKWRFQRSMSASLTAVSSAVFYLAWSGTLVSLNHDRVVRFGKL